MSQAYVNALTELSHRLDAAEAAAVRLRGDLITEQAKRGELSQRIAELTERIDVLTDRQPKEPARAVRTVKHRV